MTAKVRFSVTLDEHEYDELAVMARKHRVSMAGSSATPSTSSAGATAVKIFSSLCT